MKNLFFVLSCLALVACGHSETSTDGPAQPPEGDLSATLAKFQSEGDFENYMKKVAENMEEASSSEEMTPATTDADNADSSITNNQENSADEGGLVKRHKNFLIILRRGKLISVKLTENRGLERISSIPVKRENLDDQAWYDEVIVEGNAAYVIGYRWHKFADYQTGLTELNVFDIAQDGSLSHRTTRFFESSDYYSWRNYTARLVNGTLLFYMPQFPFTWMNETRQLHLPLQHRLDSDGKMVAAGALLHATDIYQPLEEIRTPTLHTLVRCELTAKASEIPCHAQAVLSNSGWRQYYVSNDKAYLWTAVRFDFSSESAFAYLYSFALQGSNAGALKTSILPVDQFSFSETTEGLTLAGVSLDRRPERALCQGENPMILAEIPFSDFSQEARLLPAARYTCLPSVKRWAQNRFSPTHFIYGSLQDLVVVERGSKRSKVFNLPFSLQRIELAGAKSLVMGTDYEANQPRLGINAVFPSGGELAVLGEPTWMDQTTGGEWRSHGYLYQGDEREGRFGLATVEWPLAMTNDYWIHQQASVSFFKLEGNGNIRLIGSLEKTDFTQPQEKCTTSCIDWYGNTRPIFLEDQILGLMGDQLTSATLSATESLLPTVHLNINTGERKSEQ